MAVLGGIAAGGIQEYSLIGKQPVAIARSANTLYGIRTQMLRQWKSEPGVYQESCFAGPGCPDNDIPGQFIKILPVPSAL